MSGTVTISLEIELAWGLVHDAPDHIHERLSRGRRRETETLDRLLTVCDELALPVSFDVVGHLLLKSCPGTHDGPHPNGWFDRDPGGERTSHPLFYAPDLIERIREATTDHEICTHTFSHSRCDIVSPDVVDWELDTVERLHVNRGLAPPRSFVPPVHAPPPKSVLTEHGIRTLRTPTELRPPVREPEYSGGAIGDTLNRVRRSHPVEMLFRTPVVTEPTVVDDIVETYISWHASLSAPYLPTGQTPPHPAYRVVPLSLRQHHHRRFLSKGLRAAANQDSAIHYWSHLFDISNASQLPPVESFLRTLAASRDRGDVRVDTMADLGDHVA